MPLTDRQLTQWATVHGGIDAFDPDCVNPASYDLKLGGKYIDYEGNGESRSCYNGLTIYPRTLKVELHNLLCKFIPRGYLFRKPTGVLVVTYETIFLYPNLAAEVKLKTTPSRKGLGHPIADWIDPGYYGRLTLMLHALKEIHLDYKQRICQLVVYQLDETAQKPYNGHYQKMFEPMKAWDE